MTVILLLQLALVRPLPPHGGRRRTAEGLEHSLASLRKTSGVVQIDVENVRGVGTGFHLPHRALLSATSCWTAAHNLTGRVVLVVDHGDEECAFLLPSGVAVAFAGPS